MTFATNSIIKKWLIRITLVVIVMMLGVSNVQSSIVPYLVWGYVHNSDGSDPLSNDITITAYLKKNPSGTYVLYNINNGFQFDLMSDAGWGYENTGTGGTTVANPGDTLILEFENTNSGSPFFGETGMLKDALGMTVSESPQQFGANDYALPVELSSFEAKIKNQNIFLSWTTQSERDNLGFYIYKSTDNGPFNKLNYTLIEGAGTSTYAHDYEFVDLHVAPGHNYVYRLESVDINGKVHSYHPISVTMDETGKTATANTHQLQQNFPNPFNPTTTISYSLNSDTHASLAIYNVIGDKIVELVNENQSMGTYSYQWSGIDASGTVVPSGLYFYKLETHETTLVQRMVFSK